MFEMWKDFLALCYETVEKMEEKSAQQGDMGKQKWEEMRDHLKEKTAKTRERMEEQINEMKSERGNRRKNFIEETGLASKEELAEVREMLADLSKKIDGLASKKPAKKK